VVAIDAKRRQGDDLAARGAGWDVYTHGGRRNTGLDAVDWARRMAEHGAGEILLTTQVGFDTELLAAIADAAPVPVIASGGAGTLGHFAEAVTKGRADAVLAASVFHDGVYTVGEVKAAMARDGVPVRR